MARLCLAADAPVSETETEVGGAVIGPMSGCRHTRAAQSGCSLSAPATAPCLAAQTTDTERGQTVMFTSGRLRESSLRMDRADSQGDWIC